MKKSILHVFQNKQKKWKYSALQETSLMEDFKWKHSASFGLFTGTLQLLILSAIVNVSLASCNQG